MKRWRRDTSEGVVLVAVVCWSVEEAKMGMREGGCIGKKGGDNYNNKSEPYRHQRYGSQGRLVKHELDWAGPELSYVASIRHVMRRNDRV
jgi:hypothetical protein